MVAEFMLRRHRARGAAFLALAVVPRRPLVEGERVKWLGLTTLDALEHTSTIDPLSPRRYRAGYTSWWLKSPARLSRLLQIRTLVRTLNAMDEFPPVRCPCCGQFNGITYTVPLRLVKPGRIPWQHLCADCFRAELEAEPSDDLAMHPIRHGERSRRR